VQRPAAHQPTFESSARHTRFIPSSQLRHPRSRTHLQHPSMLTNPHLDDSKAREDRTLT
jgi:hypothetical protein